MNLDGASDSKPALKTVQEHRTPPSLERKPSKLRRFMFVGSRDRKSLSRLGPSSNAVATTPLQTLSPRPTDLEPGPKKRTKRSMSSFLLPRSPASEHGLANNKNVEASTVQDRVPVTESAQLLLPTATVKEDEDSLKNQGHLPVTGKSHLSKHNQSRKDSATKSFYDMPLFASRTAALTSHPVGKENLESEQFHTPKEVHGTPEGNCIEK